MTQRIEKIIIIHASPSTVWKALTDPGIMKQWMAEPEMEIEILTDWKIGNPIVIKAFHHVKFENKGTVLQFERDKVLQYNYLSSISHLPEIPENFTSIKFKLETLEDKTAVTLTLENFPTETILKHVELYWGTTLELMRSLIEKELVDQ
jgi:uncharacterized protein YndB with AHSA1/START domain